MRSSQRSGCDSLADPDGDGIVDHVLGALLTHPRPCDPIAIAARWSLELDAVGYPRVDNRSGSGRMVMRWMNDGAVYTLATGALRTGCFGYLGRPPVDGHWTLLDDAAAPVLLAELLRPIEPNKRTRPADKG